NRVLGYLKATSGQAILISRAIDPVLTAYCDSNWLGCLYTRRSRTGYMLLLGETLISWKTKKQSLVSRSLDEAEYNAMASPKTKHVEMDCYFVRERVESKEIIPMKISSKLQIADLLTKGLPASVLKGSRCTRAQRAYGALRQGANQNAGFMNMSLIKLK
nr:hypothetical protein [Tanacetum cinerariifolium]GEZ90053.1 hypothetical protein [Tanacetum cinerariifolium]